MARSGTYELPVGDEGSFSPQRWYPVCSIGDLAGIPSAPRTVRIRVGKSSYAQSLYQASLPAGVWWEPDSDSVAWVGGNYFGVIRFSYGYKGMQRELYCDLRSGEYQIPPCEFLRVEATRYTPATTHGGEDPFVVDPTPFVIEGEIADQVATDFSPMLFTAKSFWGGYDVGDYAQVAAPPGAYAFEVYPATALIFSGNYFRTLEPASFRSYADSVYVPPSSPLPLINAYVQISAGTTVKGNCDLVYWVR